MRLIEANPTDFVSLIFFKLLKFIPPKAIIFLFVLFAKILNLTTSK